MVVFALMRSFSATDFALILSFARFVGIGIGATLSGVHSPQRKPVREAATGNGLAARSGGATGSL
jgi:hypothetical protein